MKKINVYLTSTNYSPNFRRDFRKLFEQIIDQLKAHPAQLEIISSDDSLIKTAGDVEQFRLFDCEMLVEYDGAYKGISLADFYTPLAQFFMVDRNIQSSTDVFLIPQGNANDMLWGRADVKTLTSKILGGIYVPQEPDIDFDTYRKLRATTNKKDMFVFKGNVDAIDRRTIYELIDIPYYSGREILSPPDTYFKNVIEHKVGLCIPGIGELCYRDIEYMAMGIPMMKFEYMTNLYPKLEPNVHYIAIPRIDSDPSQRERVGGREYAELYIQRFLEVKDDLEFLEYISNNAMNYYDTYLHPVARIKHVFDLWELPFYQ